MNDCVRVTATLRGLLAAEPPRLDSLLIDHLVALSGNGHRKWEIDRQRPLPADIHDRVPIPLLHRTVGKWKLPCCSMPIYQAEDGTDKHQYFVRKLGAEYADLLAEDKRLKFATTNSEFKSYRLPLRVRHVRHVVWFARAERKGLHRTLKRIKAIGKKTAHGYGAVESWTVDRIDADMSWFAQTDYGTLLMAVLPAEIHVPPDLIGARRDFGAPVPPYWHPDNYTEILVPC